MTLDSKILDIKTVVAIRDHFKERLSKMDQVTIEVGREKEVNSLVIETAKTIMMNTGEAFISAMDQIIVDAVKEQHA